MEDLWGFMGIPRTHRDPFSKDSVEDLWGMWIPRTHRDPISKDSVEFFRIMGILGILLGSLRILRDFSKCGQGC